ncbi:MAG: FAD-dependent oxidoreductase [Desulfobacterales bacterium]|uniref:FAD-dependent oxidoreductase n=1 Tax=Candidatus Desulfatibia vada TaxID=2841696 RepID=A0A8J6TRC7_9BACT|nr:FAD-dependent oxidoreductase [Candidatus Desulfatibia vada]
MEHKIIILGGGISGLSLAWRLSSKGLKVHVLESESEVGGLAGTLRKDGYCMDIGPHSFFSDDSEIVDTVLELFDNKLIPKPREVKFLYQDRYLDYPLSANSVLFQMGFWSGVLAGLSFMKSRIMPKKRSSAIGEEETVEDWAIENFGEHLYRTFFKPYTEQFWKMPCSELSSRTIPTHTRMSFLNTLRLLLLKPIGKKGSSLIEREMLPTFYPDTGFAEIAERVTDAARDAGTRIQINSSAAAVEELPNGRVRVRYECEGELKEIEGSHVVSTIPLNQFVKILSPAAPPEVQASAKRLDYRSLIALGMVTEKQNILNCGYIYVLDRPYNRISDMNEFSPATSPEGDNILMLEIPCLRDSVVWSASKEELFDMCIGSLAKDGFLAPGDVKRLLIVKAPYAYPIYRKDYAQNLNKLLDHINGRKGISTLGRAGEFIYMDIDKCMRKAFDFADLLIEDQTGYGAI